MSEAHDAERPSEGSPPSPPEEIAPPAAELTRPHRASRQVALWLAALLVLGIAGVALSPFWAPNVAPLLPWGERAAVSADEYAGLAARVRAIETQPTPLGGEIEKRPAAPLPDLDAIKSAMSALARRVEELEAAPKSDHQTAAADAANKAALHQLEQRLAAVETQSSSRTAGATAEVQKLQQELSRLDNGAADISNRLSGIERQVRAQISSERNDAVEALLLLQMREAVEQARPFPAAYSAFRALDHDPQLATAAEPLAEAARNGVASHAVLSKRLAELAGQVATAKEPPAESDWGAQALAQLRGLVTIRRIDGASQTIPEAAVKAAQAALARGDLAGAVTAMEPLTGANAEAARPWLQMARERLSVEKTLDHLQALLTARLGNSPPDPAPATAPAASPVTKAPS